ncbi:MAG TPA: Ig-like domain-containing protein [Streptosporangiaceae bacterium]|nr:Ig-like domain-containing protein [Streptosporangiaceae bacterium]
MRIKWLYSLLASGLMLATGTGVALAANTSPGHTIAAAGTLTIGGTTNGGGGPADFWKVTLRGGDAIQFISTTPNSSTYVFALYTPGTTDANFASATSFSSATTNFNGQSVFDLQAPYNGTFILAVCQGPNVSNFNCSEVDTGGADNPMDAYSFKTSLVNGGVSEKVAAAETKAAPSIAKAPIMSIGHFEAGGANPADFWKVTLRGGDVVQIASTTANNSTYVFALYPPGTNGTNFPATTSFSSATTNFNGKTVFDLQAPYNGTFLLAVCQGPNVSNFNCSEVDTGGAFNPMSPYTFTTSFVKGGISAKVASRETKASPRIAKAPKMPVGNFEAGGANPADFWKVTLNAGDVVQFSSATPASSTYVFALYKQGTNDTNFPAAKPVASGTTSFTGKSVFRLRAPRTSTYVLVACQGPNVSGFNCSEVDTGGAFNPMSPYTFATSLAGGRETRTSLRISATSIKVGHEKTIKFSFSVKALHGGKPTGKVRVSDGKKTVCMAKLVKGSGSCSPASGNAIPAGKYSMTASYAGNLLGSKSSPVTLTVKR